MRPDIVPGAVFHEHELSDNGERRALSSWGQAISW
jgi:hypothetical protein